MPVKTRAELLAEWTALAAAANMSIDQQVDGFDALLAGGCLSFPLPPDGSSTSVQIGESWTLLNPWTVATPASGKGVISSTITGIMTIESGGDGWYECDLRANCKVAGITQPCELAIRASRGAVSLIISGARIEDSDVLQNISVLHPGRQEGASPLHFIAGDAVSLYGRTGPSGGTRTLTINSASLWLERKMASS